MPLFSTHFICLIAISTCAFFAVSATGLDDAARFDDELGEIRLIVFSAEPPLPLENVVVRAGPVILGRTNEDGALSVHLFGGLYHISFEIAPGDVRTAAIRAVPNQVVEILTEVPADSPKLRLTVEQASKTDEQGPPDTARPSAPMSAVEGRVIRTDTGKPVFGARIFVRGCREEAVSDGLGRFRMAVPSGVVDIVMVHPDFSTVTLSGIEVPPGRPGIVKIETSPGGVELEEMLVTAPKIEGSEVSVLRERRETAQVTDIIGAEQISKNGDTSAAAALKRVTGVTVVGGKYVYVRGLGERYSAAALNGLNLPSPDPERRVVPLDMFPTEILESMKIQKTFSAKMHGDFGGGTVSLRTKAYPEDFVFKLELSGGISAGSTFHSADFSSDKGPLDFLGIDAGHRDMPQILKDATRDQPLVEESLVSDGYTAKELATVTRSMPKNWGVQKKTVPPALKLSMSVGNGWKLKKASLGFLAALLYKNDWDTSQIKKWEYALDSGHPAVKNRYVTDDTINTVTLGGIFTLGVNLGDSNSIVFNTLADHITDNDFYIYEAYHSDFDARVYNYEWIERMLFSQQVIGTHTIKALKNLKLDWRYSFSSAFRNEPDKRFIRYDYADSSRDPDTLRVSVETNANRRDYLTSEDRVHDLGFDLCFPFTQWTEEKASAETGFSVTLKNRKTDIRKFAYGNLNNSKTLSDEAFLNPPWEFFIDENMGPEGMRLIQVTESTDNYSGEQEIFAYYLTSNLPLGLGFSAAVGARLEKARQKTSTYAVFSDGTDRIDRSIDNLDVLPSTVITYEIKKGMLARLGYGKTLNRPDFLEMSPACTEGYAGAGKICGAPEEIDNPKKTQNASDDVPKKIPYTLKRTVIHNVDARWEWYFSRDEILSVGAFYKKFINPVELMSRSSSDKSSELRNAKSAQNVGIELEFKKNFGFLHQSLSDLFAAGNAAWIYSIIELPESNQLIQTNQKRPLQGQSPYVVNAQIGYDNADWGLSAVLLYNVFGKRIDTVGVSGLPDIYEQPFHQLDLVIKKKIPKGFKCGFKAVNLINLPVSFTQGDRTTKTYKKGRELSLSLSWSY